MKRNFNDFITAYLEYVAETESPLNYKKWVALSVISASLQKKCHFNLGRIRIFGNTFVVLVGPPGARKSAAISFGKDLIESVGVVNTSSDSISREALLMELEASKDIAILDKGPSFTHSSLLVCASEFESFLGQKQENRKMTVTLIDLYDCPQKDWTYKTKNKGENVIPSVYLSILAATTPDSIASSITPGDSGSGFTARILFIHATGRMKDVPFPENDKFVVQRRLDLIDDLRIITQLNGEFKFLPETKEFWKENYSDYCGAGPKPLCDHPLFVEWYDRKPIFIIKLAMLISASESNDMIIRINHILRAIEYIEENEKTMGEAFRSVGMSEVASETELIFKIIRMNKKITEKELRRLTWRDLDDKKFYNVINTAKATGIIGISCFRPITYIWIGENNDRLVKSKEF
jgi:hypothetical protein